jgi:hypothetical protein
MATHYDNLLIRKDSNVIVEPFVSPETVSVCIGKDNPVLHEIYYITTGFNLVSEKDGYKTVAVWCPLCDRLKCSVNNLGEGYSVDKDVYLDKCDSCKRHFISFDGSCLVDDFNVTRNLFKLLPKASLPSKNGSVHRYVTLD